MTRRLQQTGVTAVLLFGGLLAPVGTQTATAPALKAAFLYNFAKFTVWPGDSLAASEPLALCVINDHAVYEALVSLTKDRAIDAHPVAVRMVKATAPGLAGCRLVFASGLDAAGSGTLIDAVAGKPVFTASDLDSFAQLGGVAGFYVESGTLRFAINLDAAQRGGLRLSSKLLTLARIVKDDRSALRR
jgi:YfiR/HmsC-like